jgi:dTDP-4-amino-4,6-dideoxygalactose transaminase
MQIPMVNLSGQYLRLKPEIDAALQDVFLKADFINGEPVKTFCHRLSQYLDTPHVIPCGNCTDALRIALQALGVGPGDEVISPAFTYIAPVEAIATVGATPVLIDVDPATFAINPALIEKAITVRTRAIIVVHLFGHSCDMEAIQKIADKYKLSVIEDNAQSFGASYKYSDGHERKLGTIGCIGTTSFFPTKPLGCYGDGGALFTSDPRLAEQILLLTNHGQTEKYRHRIVGYNSRLDTVQAAILNVKLNHIDAYARRRQEQAFRYEETLKTCFEIVLPATRPYSTHVYHQYTIQVKSGRRDALKAQLSRQGIATMVYYPLPVHEQEAYRRLVRKSGEMPQAERLSGEVLSLPIDTEMSEAQQTFIIEAISNFFIQN